MEITVRKQRTSRQITGLWLLLSLLALSNNDNEVLSSFSSDQHSYKALEEREMKTEHSPESASARLHKPAWSQRLLPELQCWTWFDRVGIKCPSLTSTSIVSQLVHGSGHKHALWSHSDLWLLTSDKQIQMSSSFGWLKDEAKFEEMPSMQSGDVTFKKSNTWRHMTFGHKDDLIRF